MNTSFDTIIDQTRHTQHILGLANHVHGVFGAAPENIADIDLLGHFFGNLDCDEVHQQRHALVLVVVTRDDPNHLQRRHHRRDRVHDDSQLPGANVLKVALERRQKLDIVLGLFVKLREGSEADRENYRV